VKTKRAHSTRGQFWRAETQEHKSELARILQRRRWKLQQITGTMASRGPVRTGALNELLKACRRGSVDIVVVWKVRQICSFTEAAHVGTRDVAVPSESILSL